MTLPSLNIPLLAAALLAGMLTGGARSHAPPQSARPAQPDSIRPYVEQLRAATRRFQDHDAAVAAGYRWMGPDMPNMGEHWINPRLVMQGRFDPLRPSCLSYVRMGGTRLLTGVAYILPVRSGEAPPSPPPGGTWHFHTSTLDEEAFGHRHHHEAEPEGVRLAMLHAWIWAENPTGLFAADNWALSYVRHGRPVPATVDPAAARALFLGAEDGVRYFEKGLTVNAVPTAEERRAVRAALIRARRQVREALQAAPPGQAPSADELAAIWHTLWHDEVRPRVRPALWTTIRPSVLGTPHGS